MSMRFWCSLTESLIDDPENQFVIDVPPYEMARLVQEFRAEDYQDYKHGGYTSRVMFYTDEEKQAFEKFLKKKGIKFTDMSK